MRVASLDWSNESTSDCPKELRRQNVSGVQACAVKSTGCSSVHFNTNGIAYQRVCGRIQAFQYGSTDAFRVHRQNSMDIDSNYVDGVSITHGAGPRRHIWTFAAALDRNISRFGSVCPCTDSSRTDIPMPPSFIGQDYFCETANDGMFIRGSMPVFYPDDPLWDGAGCENSTSTCCSFNNPPWFHKQLPSVSTDDIEMRVCINEGQVKNENIAISHVDIYVQ